MMENVEGMANNRKQSKAQKRASYVKKIWNKLQEVEKKLNDFEVNNTKEHQELRNMINGLGQSKDEQRK